MRFEKLRLQLVVRNCLPLYLASTAQHQYRSNLSFAFVVAQPFVAFVITANISWFEIHLSLLAISALMICKSLLRCRSSTLQIHKQNSVHCVCVSVCVYSKDRY